MKKFISACLLVAGFWFVLRPGYNVQAGSSGNCASGKPAFCADANGDGQVDLADPIYTLSWLFTGGPQPTCCADTSQGSADWALNQAIPVAGRKSEGRFVDNGDGTITDLTTGLMWQQRTADWQADNVIDEHDMMSWDDAKRYASLQSLGGHSGWRLPTVREMESIIDRTTLEPAIDSSFTDTSHAIGYWSGSVNKEFPEAVYAVKYRLGEIFDSSITAKHLLRLVRNP